MVISLSSNELNAKKDTERFPSDIIPMGQCSYLGSMRQLKKDISNHLKFSNGMEPYLEPLTKTLSDLENKMVIYNTKSSQIMFFLQ